MPIKTQALPICPKSEYKKVLSRLNIQLWNIKFSYIFSAEKWTEFQWWIFIIVFLIPYLSDPMPDIFDSLTLFRFFEWPYISCYSLPRENLFIFCMLANWSCFFLTLLEVQRSPILQRQNSAHFNLLNSFQHLLPLILLTHFKSSLKNQSCNKWVKIN